MKTNDIILNAFANGDLINVLRGTGAYSVGLDQWVSADVPTDWTRVLPLFYKYANEIGLDRAKEMLENAILTLLNSNAEDLYIGMSVLYLQIWREESNRTTLKINREKLLRTAANRIKKGENELRETKRWQGRNNPNGLLAEVERYRKLLKSKFGIEMRPQSSGIRIQHVGKKPVKEYIIAVASGSNTRNGRCAALPQALPLEKYGVAKANLATIKYAKKATSGLGKYTKSKNTPKMVNSISKKVKF